MPFPAPGTPDPCPENCFCPKCLDAPSRRITEEVPVIEDRPTCVDCGVDWCYELDASYDDPLDGLLCARCRNRRK